MTITVILEVASAVFAVIAAFFWILSCLVRVKPDQNSLARTVMDEHGNDWEATIDRQRLWNSWAAGFTGLAVGLHAAGIIFRHCPA